MDACDGRRVAGPLSVGHPAPPGRLARADVWSHEAPGSGCATLAPRRSGGLREPGDPYVDTATSATEPAVAALTSTPPWGDMLWPDIFRRTQPPPVTGAVRWG